MTFLKDVGRLAGELTGKVIGGSVRVVGELAGSSFVKEIGDGVEQVTIQAGTTVGELASGTYDIAAGVITADHEQTRNGLKDVGGAVADTAKGAVNSVRYVYHSGEEIVEGIREDNDAKIRSGAKGIVLAAAVVTLGVGAVDLLDGADANIVELPTSLIPNNIIGNSLFNICSFRINSVKWLQVYGGLVTSPTHHEYV